MDCTGCSVCVSLAKSNGIRPWDQSDNTQVVLILLKPELVATGIGWLLVFMAFLCQSQLLFSNWAVVNRHSRQHNNTGSYNIYQYLGCYIYHLPIHTLYLDISSGTILYQDLGGIQSLSRLQRQFCNRIICWNEWHSNDVLSSQSHKRRYWYYVIREPICKCISFVQLAPCSHCLALCEGGSSGRLLLPAITNCDSIHTKCPSVILDFIPSRHVVFMMLKIFFPWYVIEKKVNNCLVMSSVFTQVVTSRDWLISIIDYRR